MLIITRLPVSPSALASIASGLVLASWLGCGSPSPSEQPDAAAAPACDPQADDDGDCIPNSVEGCLAPMIPDRDVDGLPDYQDDDADGDGIADTIEVGPDCTRPRDTDGDSRPDYLDVDADNDTVPDRYEDRNGDGLLGRCSALCTDPVSDCDQSAGERCHLPQDGSPVPGVCVSFDCLDGESDPRARDTDGDGIPDAAEGTFICNPLEADENPFGLAPVGIVDSRNTSYTDGDWRLALDISSKHGPVALSSHTVGEGAYVFELRDPERDVAGFLVTKAVANTDPAPATELPQALINGAAQVVTQVADVPSIIATSTRSSGRMLGADTMVDSLVDLETVTAATASAVRDRIVTALLARPADDISFPFEPWSAPPDTRFILSYQTIYRPTSGQTLYLGAIARASEYDDRTSATAAHVADVSNGTALTESNNQQAPVCAPRRDVASTDAAELIWIVSESPATSDGGDDIDDTARARIASHAEAVFARAQAAGLDLRVGVTDMNPDGPGGTPGLFASRDQSATGDRWLRAADAAAFADALRVPSGPDPAAPLASAGLSQLDAALSRHLPRDPELAHRIRPDAAVAVVIVSSAKAEELYQKTALEPGNIAPTPAQRDQIDDALGPYLKLLDEQSVQVSLIAEPLPFGPTSCPEAREHAYGFYTLASATAGITASLCQADFGPTLDLIIDALAGRGVAIPLAHRPISSSLAVTRDDVLVPRSRGAGWDYDSVSNAIVFYNLPPTTQPTSEIVVTYRRWDDLSAAE